MSEMVERVAKALYEKVFESWEDAPKWPPNVVDPMAMADRDEWLSFARAAIAAMREPTKAMIEAGQDSAYAYTDGYLDVRDKLPGVWQVMVDEALK